jgi:hypothetical protein
VEGLPFTGLLVTLLGARGLLAAFFGVTGDDKTGAGVKDGKALQSMKSR